MSTYIIHDGYCIEYGTFIMGLFFCYITPSIWVCFGTPYTHIPVRIFNTYPSPPPPPGTCIYHIGCQGPDAFDLVVG